MAIILEFRLRVADYYFSFRATTLILGFGLLFSGSDYLLP